MGTLSSCKQTLSSRSLPSQGRGGDGAQCVSIILVAGIEMYVTELKGLRNSRLWCLFLAMAHYRGAYISILRAFYKRTLFFARGPYCPICSLKLSRNFIFQLLKREAKFLFAIEVAKSNRIIFNFFASQYEHPGNLL